MDGEQWEIELTLSGNLGTVTVKVTYRGSDTYKPCEGSYTITVEQVLSNIAAFKAVSDNTSATFNLTDAQVLYNHNNGNRLYVRDASGALLLFNSGLNYEANKMLNGKMTATKTTYREQVETTGTVDGTNITVSKAVFSVCTVVEWSVERAFLLKEDMSFYFLSDSSAVFVNKLSNSFKAVSVIESFFYLTSFI